MSYRTSISLAVYSVPPEEEIALIRELRRENSISQAALDYRGSGTLRGGWEELEAELSRFSGVNPGVVFEVRGVGDGFGDIWKAFFRDGFHYREFATILEPEFSAAWPSARTA